MKKTCVVLMVMGSFALGACQSKPRAPERSPQDIPPGSTFTVHEKLTIQPDDAALYFQDTQLLPSNKLNPNYPYCRFQTADLASEVHHVEPQTLTVASTEFDERAMGASGGGVAVTQIDLQSAGKGTTYRMLCFPPVEVGGAQFVTDAEIAGALGDYMTLVLAK